MEKRTIEDIDEEIESKKREKSDAQNIEMSVIFYADPSEVRRTDFHQTSMTLAHRNH